MNAQSEISRRRHRSLKAIAPAHHHGGVSAAYHHLFSEMAHAARKWHHLAAYIIIAIVAHTLWQKYRAHAHIENIIIYDDIENIGAELTPRYEEARRVSVYYLPKTRCFILLYEENNENISKSRMQCIEQPGENND